MKTPTTDEIMEQARADIALLDIEQLRCGVMLQLLNIEALTKERDALAAAAKLALDVLVVIRNQSVQHGRLQNAIATIKQAGVQ